MSGGYLTAPAKGANYSYVLLMLHDSDVLEIHEAYRESQQPM